MRHLLFALTMLTILPLARPALSGDLKPTILVGLGYGLQNGAYGDDFVDGLGGPLFGLGAFLNDAVAVMLRYSGTIVEYRPHLDEYNGTVSRNVGSGVIALDAQWWATRRLILEGGIGYGAVGRKEGDESGVGLLAAAGWSIVRWESKSLQVTVEYAPVLLSNDTVNNISFNLAFQDW